MRTDVEEEISYQTVNKMKLGTQGIDVPPPTSLDFR